LFDSFVIVELGWTFKFKLLLLVVFKGRLKTPNRSHQPKIKSSIVACMAWKLFYFVS